ncbi:MAG: hypothetical protein M1823_005741 [Watsoniomyces obsoletus]|nr:MAG: hypothetical protein M1823_005741 [Watsoniomyces obsoletus]
MDVYYLYSYGTAAWLTLQSLPLIASPTLIVTMLSPEVRTPSVLEEYFTRTLGITLITLGLLCVLLTGSVPLTSSFSETASIAASTDPADPKAPYALPTLTITASYHTAIAFFCYARWSTIGSSAFAIATIGHACLAVIGLWVILFATSSGRISRKTGADKRMSGFPFGNTESDKKRKEGHKSL